MSREVHSVQEDMYLILLDLKMSRRHFLHLLWLRTFAPIHSQFRL